MPERKVFIFHRQCALRVSVKLGLFWEKDPTERGPLTAPHCTLLDFELSSLVALHHHFHVVGQS